MGSNIFAYGNLIIPSVFRTVTGRSFDSANAYLEGYSRFALRDRIYPGIIQSEDGFVDGQIYLDLDDEALDRLDYFEDDFYTRTEVSVSLDNERLVSAIAYIVPSSEINLLTEHPWNLRKFQEEQLNEYLKHVRKYMQKFRRAVH